MHTGRSIIQKSCGARRITFFHTSNTHVEHRGGRCLFDFKNKNSPERDVPWDRSQRCNNLRLVFLALFSVCLVRRVIATQSSPTLCLLSYCRLSSGERSHLCLLLSLHILPHFSVNTVCFDRTIVFFDTKTERRHTTHSCIYFALLSLTAIWAPVALSDRPSTAYCKVQPRYTGPFESCDLYL